MTCITPQKIDLRWDEDNQQWIALTPEGEQTLHEFNSYAKEREQLAQHKERRRLAAEAEYARTGECFGFNSALRWHPTQNPNGLIRIENVGAGN